MRLGLLTFYFRNPKGSQKVFLGSSLKFEAAQIHFLSDLFVTVVVVVA